MNSTINTVCANVEFFDCIEVKNYSLMDSVVNLVFTKRILMKFYHTLHDT